MIIIDKLIRFVLTVTLFNWSSLYALTNTRAYAKKNAHTHRHNQIVLFIYFSRAHTHLYNILVVFVVFFFAQKNDSLTYGRFTIQNMMRKRIKIWNGKKWKRNFQTWTMRRWMDIFHQATQKGNDFSSEQNSIDGKHSGFGTAVLYQLK